MQKLFDAVRKACGHDTWSRGVELARAGAVQRDQADEGSIALRVVTRGGIYCPTVTLYPDDAEWECSCSRQGGACEHAAAAVIALRQAGELDQELPEPGDLTGRLSYRFRRGPGGLALERIVVAGGVEHRVEASLAAIAAGRVMGPRFAASQADLAVELALGSHRQGPVPRHLVPRLLEALAGCQDVRIDGRPLKTSAVPVAPVAVVEDQGEGYRLDVRDDPSVSETFANGVALCGGVLRPLRASPLTGREMHELSHGRHFGPGDLAELVAGVLPSLAGRLRVEIRTDRLPRGVPMHPRIAFDLAHDPQAIEVLATLVYGDPPCARVDGGKLFLLGGAVPLRDENAEKQLLRRLGLQLNLVPGVRARLEGSAAVAFAPKLATWVAGSLREELASFRRLPPLRPSLDPDPDRFDVVFETREAGGPGEGVRRADPGAVIRAWRDHEPLVPLQGGGWAPLPADWLERFGDRVADLLAARDGSGRLPGCALPDLARLCDDLDHPRPPRLERLSALLGDFSGIPPADLPEGVAATLRPYQKRGVDWLSFLRTAGLGALLADDMGLGKTLQALCAARGRTLVVAPTSVLHNWRAEVRKFRPDLRCRIFHGDRRALDPAADLTVTTYAILRLDEEVLRGVRWDTVILDEAQAIKNFESQSARAAFALDASFRMALTGTPVENRLDELWSQLHFLNRGLLGGHQDFVERYARPIAEGDGDAAHRLRERIRPFVLRRLKREVAPELPPRTEVELRCELTPAEREVYDTVRAATQREVVERLRGGRGVLAALEALLRLRQAACHPGLVPGREAETSSKVALLLETLDEVLSEGHRALVFSQWTSLLDRVEPHLRAAGIGFERLDGSTRDREGVVARFQDESGPSLMLVSLKAGGSGLNLTAADHVFLLDPWWNPATEDQAADRAHRIGQQRPVMVYRLVAADTVEERILALKESKRALASAALGEADRAGSLTRDDLLALLE